MESSSEDSFAWTDTSKDSVDSDSMAVEANGKSKYDDKQGKKKKSRKVSDDICNGTEDEHDTKPKIKTEKEHTEIKSNESMKRKMVKSEPESDNDMPKKKKKRKHAEVNGDIDNSTESYDESHLDYKVKLEDTSAASTNHTKKKKRHSSIALDETENAEELKTGDNSDISEETVKHKKKKKKSKKRNDSESLERMDVDGEEDKEAKINKSSSKTSANGSIENSFTESTILQDESGYDEISAIQGDDDNGHTISFNDSQTAVKESKKKKDTLYKSTIDSEFKKASNNIDNDISHEPGKRFPRISERLQFEDEDDPITDYSTEYGNTQESKQDKASAKLRKFINTNNDIKLVSDKLGNSSILTEDDEIWIVKCPNEIDIQAFYDKDLNLNGKCKIKVGGLTYEGNMEEGQCDTAATLSMQNGKYDVQKLPLCGIINFRKRIPKAHFRDDNIMVNKQTNFIPLPDTKCRHPLFGSNYKKAIKIPSAVAGRLNAENSVEESVEEQAIEKKKKKKHKRDRTLDHEEVDSNSKHVMKSEPDMEVPEKKKKKRKHVDDVDAVDGPAPKKIKRIKHDPESAEAWESEKAIEENLFNF